MSSGRSAKFLETKKVLVQRLRSDCIPPGSKFMPIRVVAAEFQLSYPTAQTLIEELVKEGYLERHSTAGTFVPGAMERYTRIHLVFPLAEKNQGLFGAILRDELLKICKKEGIPSKLTWAENWRGGCATDYYVLSNLASNRIVRELIVLRRRGLILNEFPPPGSAPNYFDSITRDNFSAGILAGRILKLESNCKHPAILANPHGRHTWAQQCSAGFRAVWPRARICHPWAWSDNAIMRYLRMLFSHSHDAILCFVKAHALALTKYCQERQMPTPSIVLIAPPPKTANLPFPQISPTTSDFSDAAMRIIRNRINGDTSPAAHITLAARVLNSVG